MALGVGAGHMTLLGEMQLLRVRTLWVTASPAHCCPRGMGGPRGPAGGHRAARASGSITLGAGSRSAPVLAQVSAERPRRAGTPRPPVLPVLPTPSQLPLDTPSHAHWVLPGCHHLLWEQGLEGCGLPRQGSRATHIHSSLCHGLGESPDLPVSTRERGPVILGMPGHARPSVVALPSGPHKGPHLVPVFASQCGTT